MQRQRQSGSELGVCGRGIAMRLIVTFVTVLIFIAIAGVSYGMGARLGLKSTVSAILGATPAAAAQIGTPTPSIDPPTRSPIATATQILETATPIPRVTLPPVFTPTPANRLAASVPGQQS